MLRYYKQKQCFIKLFCKYSCCGTISKSTISSIFFVNIHICLLSVSKSLQQRYIFSCLWHCQQLPVCFKMSQSVPICLKMSQNQLNFSQNSFWDILSNFERIFGAGMRHFETFWVDFEQFWAILSDFERNLFGQQFVYLNSPFNLHVIPAQLEFTNYGDWS